MRRYITIRRRGGGRRDGGRARRGDGRWLAASAKLERGRARVTVRGAVVRVKRREVVAVADQVVGDVARRFTGRRAVLTPRSGCVCCPTTRAIARRPARSSAHVGVGLLPARQAARDRKHRREPRQPAPRARASAARRSLSRHSGMAQRRHRVALWHREAGKRGYTFLVNYRLRDLQRALAANTLPSLAALAKSTPFDITGPHAMMYYAYARYVLLYAEHKGTLGKLYPRAARAPARRASRDPHAPHRRTGVSEVARVERRQRARPPRRRSRAESRRWRRPSSIVALQLDHRGVTAAQRRRRPASRGEQDQRVEDLLVEARRCARARRGGARSAAASRSRSDGSCATWRCEVREAERDVARLVLRREPRDLARARIGRVIAEEPQQRQEAALAEHREQERRDREVGLVEQRRERGLAARGRQPELGRGGAARAA